MDKKCDKCLHKTMGVYGYICYRKYKGLECKFEKIPVHNCKEHRGRVDHDLIGTWWACTICGKEL